MTAHSYPVEMSEPNSFGELIRRRREQAGLTQAALGERVGRSASAVRNWERDQSLPGEPDVLAALARVLGLTDQELRQVLQPDRLTFDPQEVIGDPPPMLVREVVVEPPLHRVDIEPSPPSEPELVSEPPLRRIEIEPSPPAPPPAEVGKEPLPTPPVLPVEQLAQPAPAGEGEPPSTQEADLDLEPTVEIPPPVRSVRRRPTPPPNLSSHPSPPAPAYQDSTSYVEDPSQVAYYRFRAIVTATALVLMLLVLFWAVGEFRQALREVLELF